MNENKNWAGKEMKSLNDKINSCKNMLGSIILTDEELDFIDQISACRLDQINNGEDDETDRNNLIEFRNEILPIAIMTPELLKANNIPIVLPVFRLKFFQSQLSKFNKIEKELLTGGKMN